MIWVAKVKFEQLQRWFKLFELFAVKSNKFNLFLFELSNHLKQIWFDLSGKIVNWKILRQVNLPFHQLTVKEYDWYGNYDKQIHTDYPYKDMVN